MSTEHFRFFRKILLTKMLKVKVPAHFHNYITSARISYIGCLSDYLNDREMKKFTGQKNFVNLHLFL